MLHKLKLVSQGNEFHALTTRSLKKLDLAQVLLRNKMTDFVGDLVADLVSDFVSLSATRSPTN